MSKAWEIEDFLEVHNNQLHIDGVNTVDLAREHGTPLFVFSESRIRHNIARLEQVRDVIGCPLKICYAAKAMSTMAILRAVKEAGCDIEVNSGGELWKALEIGFRGDQIIFNGTSKEVWEIENAINAGIYAIQVDSLYELSLIEETAKRLDKRANVSLRLVPEIESDTHSGLQTALLTSKFGMMPDEAFSAFRQYKDSENLDLCGIHLHVGSQNPDAKVYSEALQILFANALRIYNETGIRLKHINLGGGFPVNYLRSDSNFPHLEQLREIERDPASFFLNYLDKVENSPESESLRESILRDREKDRRSQSLRRIALSFLNHLNMLEADFPPGEAMSRAWADLRRDVNADTEHILENMTVLLEPGRSIIADAGICLTTVRNRKQRPLASKDKAPATLPPVRSDVHAEGVSFGIYDLGRGPVFAQPEMNEETWLLTDAGFNILLSMETYKWYYHLVSAERSSDAHTAPYKLAGPLCDGGDVYFEMDGQHRLPSYRLLPDNVQPGEILALLNCGAYSLAQASQYNGRFLPAVALIGKDGEIQLVRRRDDFGDLVSNDIF